MMMGHETTSDAIKNALKNLAAHAPAPKLSRLEQQLAEHRDLLLKAIAKGHTTKAIAATLKDAGLEATPDSLTRMIRRVAATVAKNGTAGKASGK